VELPFATASGLLELGFGGPMGSQVRGKVEDLAEQRGRALMRGFAVELDDAGRVERLIAGPGVVAQAELVTESMVHTGRQPIVENPEQHVRGRLVNAGAFVSAVANGERRLARLVPEEIETRLNLSGRHLALYGDAGRQRFQTSRRGGEHAVDADGSAHNECHVAASVVARVMTLERSAIPLLESLESAGDRKAERVISEAQLPAARRSVDVAPLLVEPFEDLFADDVTLRVEISQQRFAQDLAEGAQRGLETLWW